MKRFIVGILIVLMLCFTGCEPMTEEELAAYEASLYHEYEVVSVFQYLSPITGMYGRVYGHELMYCFTYIDDNGHLQQVDDFEQYEYNGDKKVYIGDENKFVVNERYHTYHLYLTEETLKNITHDQGGNYE